MERAVFDATMRTLHNSRPFQPFTVTLDSGERFEVDHPGALGLRSGLGLFASPENIPVIFTHENVSSIVGDLANPAGSMT